LAVQIGPDVGKTHAGLGIDPASASRKGFARRLVAWGASISLGVLAAGLMLSSGIHTPSLAVLAIDFAFCCCAALSAAIYCFATFAISREARYALLAAGFSAWAGGSIAQLVVDLNGPGPAAGECIMSAALLASALAFWRAARAQSVLRVRGRKLSTLHLLAVAAAVLAFPSIVAALVMGLRMSRFAGESLVYAAEPSTAKWFIAFVSLALMVAAVLGSYRRFRAGGDRMSAINCYFLLACAVALVARASSTVRFDSWWWCGQVLLLGAWCVFTGAMAMENAVTHKEERDRVDEMEAMHHVSWSLIGARSVDELLDRLVRTLSSELSAKICCVYLVDETGESLVLLAAVGPEDYPAKIGARHKVLSADRRPGFHSGHTAKAFVSKEVAVAYDVFVDVEFVPWKQIAVDDSCAASLPLVDDSEAIGVLNVYFPDKTQLTKQKLQLLSTIAASVSPSIASARSGRRTQPVGDASADLAA